METFIGTSIETAANLLKEGKLVAIPTETVYGLAANAFNETAVLEIFKVKDRPSFDPLIVHVHDRDILERYVEFIPPKAEKIIEAFCPGPITLLLNKKSSIADIITSGLDCVGIRIPSHPMMRKLLEQLDFPLAAPSANPFGYVSPTSAQHVADQLWGKIPYILDGGMCEVGIESTIVGFEKDQCIIFRLGGVSVEEIEKVTGPVELRIHASSNPKAPGSLDSHYAPRKPLYFGELETLMDQHEAAECSVISFMPLNTINAFETAYLSQDGNMDEAARNLFATLRRVDQSNSKKILAGYLPEIGLGRAINDRLRRASVHI